MHMLSEHWPKSAVPIFYFVLCKIVGTSLESVQQQFQGRSFSHSKVMNVLSGV